MIPIDSYGCDNDEEHDEGGADEAQRSIPVIFRRASTWHTPASLAESLAREEGVVLLDAHWAGRSNPHAPRFSFVAARPFLEFRSFGSRCETRLPGHRSAAVQYGNPWRQLEVLVSRYEMLEAIDVPVPLGACFGYWGYGLKRFVEPRLVEHAERDLDLPDCHLGFYGSFVAFDHVLGAVFVVATGLAPDGSSSAARARAEENFWLRRLEREPEPPPARSPATWPHSSPPRQLPGGTAGPEVRSTFSRVGFIKAVRQAQQWIRQGHIYQVNLSQRLEADLHLEPWEFYSSMSQAACAPFSAYFDFGDFQIGSCSPELFLRMSAQSVVTRPIKGSRPASSNHAEDKRFSSELCSSAKERAELVMITDLLRNDLGRICDYGSIQVPDLAAFEAHPYVKHLVSTVEGQLRPGITHCAALAACFPGGSVTGAPKIRAVEIIDDLEPVVRGPYTGAVGYLGFNRESQLSIAIRTAVFLGDRVYYGTGAGIVADSDAEAEYEETLVKARIFFASLSEATASAMPHHVVSADGDGGRSRTKWSAP